MAKHVHGTVLMPASTLPRLAYCKYEMPMLKQVTASNIMMRVLIFASMDIHSLSMEEIINP